MKLTDIEYDTTMKITDFENFFNVNEIDNLYRYNLNSTLILDISEDQFLTYELKTPAQWPLISYKLYNTTRLAWLLMKINNSDLRGSFTLYQPGTKIKYLPEETIKIILRNLD